MLDNIKLYLIAELKHEISFTFYTNEIKSRIKLEIAARRSVSPDGT